MAQNPSDIDAFSADTTGRIVSFASIGVFTTVQEVSMRAATAVDGVDADLLAEETLCLVSVATARAVAAAAASHPEIARTTAGTLLEFPWSWRDYLLGRLSLGEDATSTTATGAEVGARIERKLAFYAVHFVEGQMPSESIVRDKMLLWMGRISPPGLPDSPESRLERSDLVAPLRDHIRLVASYVQHCMGFRAETD